MLTYPQSWNNKHHISSHTVKHITIVKSYSNAPLPFHLFYTPNYPWMSSPYLQCQPFSYETSHKAISKYLTATALRKQRGFDEYTKSDWGYLQRYKHHRNLIHFTWASTDDNEIQGKICKSYFKAHCWWDRYSTECFFRSVSLFISWNWQQEKWKKM